MTSNYIRLAILLFFSMLSLSKGATADEDARSLGTVTVFAKQIPHYLDDIRTSPLGRFLQELKTQSGLDLDIRLLPPKRATVLFEHGDADMLIPFPKEHGVNTSLNHIRAKVIASTSIAPLQRHILTLPGKQHIHHYQDLKDLRVGVVLGYDYGPEFEQLTNTEIFRTGDQVNLMNMLYRGRVDAILSFPFEATLIAGKLGYAEQPVYDPNFPVSAADLVILMQDNARGQRLKKWIDQSLEQLRKRGELLTLKRAFQPQPDS